MTGDRATGTLTLYECEYHGRDFEGTGECCCAVEVVRLDALEGDGLLEAVTRKLYEHDSRSAVPTVATEFGWENARAHYKRRADIALRAAVSYLKDGG